MCRQVRGRGGKETLFGGYEIRNAKKSHSVMLRFLGRAVPILTGYLPQPTSCVSDSPLHSYLHPFRLH